MTWRPDDPQGNEAAKIKHLIVPYTRGQGLDLGCGPWKAFPHFISVDDFDEWRGYVDPQTGQPWRPDIFGDATDLKMFADGSLDFVFSSHLLEHLEDTEAALREWWRVVNVGGHLVLYLPHKDLYPNIGEEGANPDHKHDFDRTDIRNIMLRFGGWELVENQKRDGGHEYSFLQVYRKEKGTRHGYSFSVKDATNVVPLRTCLVIRYGGIGDMIQLSSILPGLKEQGYRVTLNTTPRGHDILKVDPHVDDFLLQDIDQVPNVDLNDYWAALGREYDKVINLSESCEGTLLALPGRRDHALPHAARHRLMDVNYQEFVHAIAGVPPLFRQAFYPTPQERKAALAYRKKLGGAPVILWALAGSSVHKVWPWTDQVVAWLIEHTKVKVMFVGAQPEQLLEAAIAQQLLKTFLDVPYEESHEMKLSDILLRLKEHFGGVNRVVCRSGSMSIRETLAFVEHADLVIGPETGVLNAAGMLPMPKVVFLSHSSPENLTKHWANTTALESRGCPESPCHRMHYDRDFCPEHEETGASLCAAALEPKVVYEAIVAALGPKAIGVSEAA